MMAVKQPLVPSKPAIKPSTKMKQLHWKRIIVPSKGVVKCNTFIESANAFSDYPAGKTHFCGLF